eukprot:gene19929-20438_t
MYDAIARALELFVPLFELSLGSYNLSQPRRIDAGTSNSEYVKYSSKSEYYEELYDEEDDRSETLSTFIENMEENDVPVPVVMPTMPEEFLSSMHALYNKRGQSCSVMDGFKLKGRRLQVIVKMSSVFLTPEKPTYHGGHWHLEGMDNERIVATGIYYYSMSNISSSRLKFRTRYNPEDFDYEQNEYEGLEAVFGFKNHQDPPLQEAGDLEAIEGRFAVFPNYAQHQLQPFGLKDPSLPGHRKVLCFFLVNPDLPIVSTSSVPPQIREWLEEQLTGVFRGRLPPLCVSEIVDYLGSTFSKREAQDLLEKDMGSLPTGNAVY